LAVSTVIECIVRDRVHITCIHAQLEAIRNTVHAHQGEVLQLDLSGVAIVQAALPRSRVDHLLHEWSTQGISAKREDQEK